MEHIFSFLEASITSVWGMLGFASLLLIGGIGRVWHGWRYTHPPAPTYMPKSSRKRWLADLNLWGALAPYTPDSERERLLRQYMMLTGYEWTGEGLAILLAAVALAGFVITKHTAITSLSSLSSTEALLVLHSMFWSFIALTAIGSLLGYHLGASRLSRARQLYPEIEPRSVRDYVAPWLWIAPVATPTAILAVTLYLGAVTSIQTSTEPALTMPVLASGLMLAAATCTLLRARWIAHASNTLTTGDPLTTQRANDCYKAHTIGSELTMSWYLSPFMLINTVIFWDHQNAFQAGPLGSAPEFILMIAAIVLLGTMPYTYIASLRSKGGGSTRRRLQRWRTAQPQ